MSEGNDNLGGIRKCAIEHVNVNAGRTAVRSKPQKEPDLVLADPCYAVREVSKTMRTPRVPDVRHVERGTATFASSRDDEVRQRLANDIATDSREARQRTDHAAFPLAQRSLHAAHAAR